MNFHRFMDEIGVRNMWRYPRPPVGSTVRELEELASLPAEELNIPVGPAGLEPVMGSEHRNADGVSEDHFTFPSPLPSGTPELDTAYCVRWSREGAKCAGRVALVMAHGAYAASSTKPLLFVPDAGVAEWDTWFLELPEHMRRQRPTSRYSGEYMVTADAGRITRGLLQTQAELRSLATRLVRMGYERVVLVGTSIGASPVLQALVRCGPEVAGAVGIVPSIDAYAGLWTSLLGRSLRPVGNASGITDDLARRVLAHITPRLAGPPRIDPSRVLLAYGRHDLVARPHEALDLSREWGGCVLRGLNAGHATLIAIYGPIRRMVGAWMRRVVPECALA
ncbi:MAG: alpha/beta fold hydrolase [Planctomycetota bacterium]|jgi:predicted alpha/beta hydrolase family esterase